MPNPISNEPGSLDVPTIPQTASPSIITEVNLPAPKVEKVNVADAFGIKGPQDIFGPDESAEKVNERFDAAAKRDAAGRFLPKDTAKPDAAKPAPKATQKPVAAKVVTPAAAKPKEPAKIKIGDQEKTADEWAAYHKELADKAAPAKADEPDPKEDEPAYDEAKEREAFIAEEAKRYAPNQVEFDKMLESGDAATFGRFLANVAADARKWVTDNVGKLFEAKDKEISELRAMISPVSQQYKDAEQYQTENQFLTSNPEIKAITDADPSKLEVHRELNTELQQEHEAMLSLVAQNPNNAWAKRRAEEISKDFLGELAKLTKARLGIAAAAPTATPAGPDPAKPKLPAAEKPLGGDRPGVTGAPRTESNEARLAREVLAGG